MRIKKLKLSIVTVCYNSENCIEKTIQSILGQTESIYEYIVIDGASKDKTYQIVCNYDYIFKEKGIIYKHISEKDEGISDAFNKGISLATGDLIGLINADDELLPDACKLLRQKYEEVESDIYYGNCIWVDSARNIEYVSKPKHELKKLLYFMILIHPSTFVKKTAYNQCGVFDKTYKLCMDRELLYRMYKAGKKFTYIDQCLTKFKAGGVSDTHLKAVHKEGSRVALQYGEPWLKVKIIEYYKLLRNCSVRLLKITPLYFYLKKHI